MTDPTLSHQIKSLWALIRDLHETREMLEARVSRGNYTLARHTLRSFQAQCRELEELAEQIRVAVEGRAEAG